MSRILEPALEELLESSSLGQVLEIIIRTTNANDVPKYVKIITQMGDVITCRVPSNKIRELKNHKSILSIRAPRPLFQSPVNEASSISKRSNLRDIVNDPHRRLRKFTGKGVALAFIDEGIDFTSKSFLDKDGNTRFEAMWLQNCNYSANRPNKYGYGAIYRREEIDAALRQNDPFSALEYHPVRWDHGTAVCEIAAGSQSFYGENLIPGIASDSYLIYVNLGPQNVGGLSSLNDSLRLLEALDFISDIAGKSPLIVNISMGNTGGPHDQSTNVVRGIDNFVSQSSSMLAVMSTGNYGDARIHTNGIIKTGEKKQFTWNVDPLDVTYNELEVWYSGYDKFIFGIASPFGNEVLTVQIGEKKPIIVNGIKIGMMYHRKDSLNHDHVIDVFLYKGAPPGKWRVTLFGSHIVNGSYHAWIERDTGNPHNQSKFDFEDATRCSTIGSICNGLYSIAVGAFDDQTAERSLAPFSSCGPTRTGIKKPDLLAPGVQIPVRESSDVIGHNSITNFIPVSGTSFAAPYVSGTLALMFEACHGKAMNLELRNILLSSTTKNSDDINCTGNGYLNIDAAIDAVIKIVTKNNDELNHTINSNESKENANQLEIFENIKSITGESNFDQFSHFKNNFINNDFYNHFKLNSLIEDDDIFLDEDLDSGMNSPFKNSVNSYSSMIYPQYQNYDQLFTDQSLSRSEIIKIANDYILSHVGSIPSELLLFHVLLKCKILDVSDVWLHQYLTPSILFDYFRYQRNHSRLNLDDVFEIIARPGERYTDKFDYADITIRRIYATKYAYAWFIVNPKLLSYEEVLRNNLNVEKCNSTEKYVQIIEGGKLPRSQQHSFCRIALDELGKIPENQLVIRLKLPNITNQSDLWSLSEAPPKSDPKSCKDDYLKFKNTFPQAVREALANGWIDSAITLAIHYGIRDHTKLTKLGYLSKYGEELGYCYPLRKDDPARGSYLAMVGQVKDLLSKPFPPLTQKGLIKCQKRERRLDSAHPDIVGFDITGRYEFRYIPKSSDSTTKYARITEFIMTINQAGKHIEGFITTVLRPGSRQADRSSTRFHGDLQDDGARFLVFSRERPDLWWGYLSYELVGSSGRVHLQMMTSPDPYNPGQQPKHALSKVSDFPTLMEWDWIFSNTPPPNWEILYFNERWPLSMDQINHLTNSLKEDLISPLLQIYFSTPFDDTVLGKEAVRKSSRKLNQYLENVFTDKDFGIFFKESYNNEVNKDIITASYYARIILSQNRWTFKQKTLSQLDWIQMALDGLTQFGGGLLSAKKYLGLKPTVLKGGKPVDMSVQQNKYKVSFKLRGLLFYYRGEITISKETGQHRWKETFKISLWGLQVKPGLTIEEDGEALTYSDWQPSDIPGKVVFLTAALGGKAPIVKARVGAWIMQIFGSELYAYLDVQGIDTDVGIHGGFKTKPRIDLVNLGGLRGEIYDKKLPDIDYSKFSPIVDFSAAYGIKEYVHFCLDSAILTEDGRQALRIICASYLPSFMNPDSVLEIIGNADRLDNEKNNYELSKWRAENTKQAVVDILGNNLMIKKINTWGEGEKKAEKSDPDQTPNPEYRRVDIFLNSRLIVSLKSG